MPSNNDKRKRQQRAEQMRKERERADARRRNLLTVGIVAVVVILIAVAGIAIKSQVDKNNAPAVTPKGLTKDGGVVYDQKAATGSASTGASPVDVVLYEDFGCPVCKAFEADSGAFLEQQVKSGAISLEYRPVAFLDRNSPDAYSSRAASAAICVFRDTGAKGYQAFLNLLYPNQPAESQPGLTDAQLQDFAKQAGSTKSASCIKDRTYQKWAKDQQNGSFAKYNGTPTVLVNGKQVSGAQQGSPPSQQELQAAIAAAAK